MRKEWLRYGLVFSLGLPVLFYRYGSFWSAYWWTRWGMLTVIFAVLFSIEIARRTSLWLLPMLLTLMLSAANAAVSPFNEAFTKLPPQVYLESTRHALYGFSTIIGVGLTWVWLPATFAGAVRSFLVSTFWISLLITTAQGSFSEPRLRYGVVGNGGISAMLMAALLPMVIERWKSGWTKGILIAAVAACCFWTQTSNGVGCLLVALSLMAGFTPWVVLLWAIGLAIGWKMQVKGDELFKFQDRLDIWKMVYKWWHETHPWWTGVGFGTTAAFLIYLGQIQKDEVIYFFGHSDWLQLAWETGIAGCVSVAIAWFWFARRAWQNQPLFIAMMTFSAGAVFNFPARLPVTFGVGLLLSWMILRLPPAARWPATPLEWIVGTKTGAGWHRPGW